MFKKNKNRIYVFIVLLLMLYISLVNLFPLGYIFTGNDVTQYINLKNTYGNLFYTWDQNGEGGFMQYSSYLLFYFPFYILDIIKIPPSIHSLLYFLIFLIGSFLSFFLSTKVLKEGYEKNIIEKNIIEIRILLSLLYAINPYTFYVFTYTWGYSPFLILYTSIPILFAYTYAYFRSLQILDKNVIILGIAFFISNISFGNFSFFVSLVIFLMLFIIMVFLLKLTKIEIGLIFKKIATLVFIMISTTSLSIIQQIVNMQYLYSSIINQNTIFDLGSWILYQRLDILSQFCLTINFIRYNIISPGLTVLWTIPFVSTFYIVIRKKNKLSTIFLFLGLLSIFITSKGKGILSDEETLKIFTLPIINILRSYDKTFIFLPFFIIISINTVICDNKKYIKGIIIIVFLTSIGLYPFFIGGIQTRYSIILDADKDYKTSYYSFLVKIPDEYFDFATELNNDEKQYKIFNLPYSVINSIGWVNYPKWKVVGVDPTTQLFNKPSIQPNSYGSFNFNYGLIWNTDNITDSKWIIKLISLENARYIIYHKDVDNKFIEQTRDKIQFLAEEQDIKLIKKFNNFDVYTISDKYILPHIYTTDKYIITGSTKDMFNLLNNKSIIPGKTIIFDNNSLNKKQTKMLEFMKYNCCNAANISMLNVNVSKTIKSEYHPWIIFRKINPTKYNVQVENATKPFFLIFSESYHPEWKAYIDNTEMKPNKIIANYDNVKVKEARHEMAFTPGDISYLFKHSLSEDNHYVTNGYANAWYIDPKNIDKNKDGNFNIILYFKPQSYFYIGLFVSMVTFAICICYIICGWQTNKK